MKGSAQKMVQAQNGDEDLADNPALVGQGGAKSHGT